MATETVASDHTSTDEQFEKKVDEEANGQKSVSLSSENEGIHDKAEDSQDQATPSSKTEAEAGGYEKKAEHAVVKADKSEDSPALEASAEDNLKHDKVEDAQGPGPAATSSKTEGEAKGDKKKAEPAVVVVEKIDGSVSSEASVADNLKEEKELIPDSQTISVTEPAPDAAKNQPAEPPPTEATETKEEKQPKTAEIPEASVETVEKLSNTAEASPLIESEAGVVKETEHLETSSQKIDKPEPAVTESEEPEKESQDTAQEAEQPNTVAISDPSAETNEKPYDAIEKPEPIVTEVHEKSEEPEKETQEKPQEAEQPNTAAVSDPSAETNKKLSDAIEEKTAEPELDAEASKENYEAGHTETEKTEPVVTEIKENSSEPEKQSFEKEEEEQLKTVIHQTESESAEKPGDAVEVQPPQESDIEVVKETGNSNFKAVPDSTEKPELVSTEVEEKPREQLEAAEIVRETAKSKETSDDPIKEPMSLKVEQTDKVEETSITGNNAQVSLIEEAQAATANVVESSPAVAEKVVEEDGKKEANITDEIEGVSKEVVGVLKDPDQASINQEAKTDFKEEREYPAPISVEEKVAANDDMKQPGAPDAAEGSSREAEVEIQKVEEQKEAKTATTEAGGVKAESVKDDRPAVDNEKKGHPETKVDEVTIAVSEQVRETLASKLEEKEEEPIKNGVDNLKKVQIVDTVKTDVQIPEPTTKETDATKTAKDLPKETPAKSAQKHSNNILSKVKQSLVRAKKAITGKSPTSKTISSQAKGDIQVK